MTISLSYDPQLSRVRIAADGLPPAPVTVERSTDQVRWATVRGGAGITPVDGDIHLDDYEFEPDVENFYRVSGPLVYDTFDRTVTDGWGPAASGQSWVVFGGTVADYSVSGGVGRHSVSAVNSARTSYLDLALADVDFTVSAVVSELATGAQITFGALARRTDSSNYYMTEVLLGTDQSVQIRVRKVVSGVFTTLQTSPFIPGLVHAPTTRFRLRFAVVGSTIRAKVWTGSTEPDWQVSATDTDIVGEGTFGCRSVLLSGNTNTLPVEIDYDDLVLTSYTGVLDRLAPWFTDDFSRVVAGGWGNGWTVEGGSTADYQVDGESGIHDAQKEVATKRSLRPGPVDMEITFDVSIPEIASGDSPQPVVLFREDGNNQNFYALRLLFMPTGELELRVAARIDGIEQTVVANPPGTQGTYTGGTVCHLRWRMIGPHVWGKVWTDDDPEPVGWQLYGYHDLFRNAGRVGFRSAVGDVADDWQGTVPLRFTYDNVVISAPASITPVLDTVWLKSLARPFLNRPVTVVDWSDVTRTSRSGVFQIVGRSRPIAVTDLHGPRQWTLDVAAHTEADAENLDLLISTGEVQFIHVPRGSRIPGGYVALGDTAERRPQPRSQRRIFSLALTECAPPSPDVIPAVGTWTTVLNTYATWADLLAAHPTWGDLMQLVGSPEDVIVP